MVALVLAAVRQGRRRLGAPALGLGLVVIDVAGDRGLEDGLADRDGGHVLAGPGLVLEGLAVTRGGNARVDGDRVLVILGLVVTAVPHGDGAGLDVELEGLPLRALDSLCIRVERLKCVGGVFRHGFSGTRVGSSYLPAAHFVAAIPGST